MPLHFGNGHLAVLRYENYILLAGPERFAPFFCPRRPHDCLLVIHDTGVDDRKR
jgi:hypothetical protein